MKKKILVLVMVASMVILNAGLAAALQEGEVNYPGPSIFYGVQTLNGDLMAVNFGGEVGFSSNFGLEGMVTYYQEKEDNLVLDLNSKLAIVHDQDVSVSALAGIHTQPKNFSQIYPRVGVLVSKHETSALDMNAGIDFLLRKPSDYIGYMLGFDYGLTRHIHIEVEHRRFSGQAKTEGLNVGMRYHF